MVDKNVNDMSRSGSAADFDRRPINDAIRVKVPIKQTKAGAKRPNHGIVAESLEAVNEKRDTVLVMEYLLLVERRTISA